MNTVYISGNLVRDMAIKYTKNGTAHVFFTIAVNKNYIDKETNESKQQTAYINCVAWGKKAEALSAAIKGTRIFVQGELRTRSYEKEGTTMYVTEVLVNEFFMNEAAPAKEFSNFDGFGDTVHNEEIPF